MPAFFLALTAVSLATLCGRDAVRMAQLSSALGRRLPLLVAGGLACAMASGVAAWSGAAVASALAPQVRPLLVAGALALAALELAVLRAGAAPAEPTRAFGAILLVHLVALTTSAGAMLVFALACKAANPWPVAAGGALGSGVAITAAWRLGDVWNASLALAPLRYGVAALVFAAALVTALGGRGPL